MSTVGPLRPGETIASCPSVASPTTSTPGSASSSTRNRAHERLVVGDRDTDHSGELGPRGSRRRASAGVELTAGRDPLPHPGQAVAAAGASQTVAVDRRARRR